MKMVGKKIGQLATRAGINTKNHVENMHKENKENISYSLSRTFSETFQENKKAFDTHIRLPHEETFKKFEERVRETRTYLNEAGREAQDNHALRKAQAGSVIKNLWSPDKSSKSASRQYRSVDGKIQLSLTARQIQKFEKAMKVDPSLSFTLNDVLTYFMDKPTRAVTMNVAIDGKKMNLNKAKETVHGYMDEFSRINISGSSAIKTAPPTTPSQVPVLQLTRERNSLEL
jgi:hypothetical protein